MHSGIESRGHRDICNGMECPYPSTSIGGRTCSTSFLAPCNIFLLLQIKNPIGALLSLFDKGFGPASYLALFTFGHCLSVTWIFKFSSCQGVGGGGWQGQEESGGGEGGDGEEEGAAPQGDAAV